MVTSRRRVSDCALLLLAIVLLALAVRVVLALDAPPSRIAGDPAVYDQLGVSIAAGRGWSRPAHARYGPARDTPTALHPPAWPLVLGATYALTDHEDRLDVAAADGRPPDLDAGAALAVAGGRWSAGRLVNAALGTTGVALLGLIGMELWGPGVGLVAAAVGALYPSLALLGVPLLSEPLFVALELAALYTALRARRGERRWAWIAATGLLAGLAVLTRANGAVLLLPLALAVWRRPAVAPDTPPAPRAPAATAPPAAPAAPRRRALAAPLALVAVAVAVVAPWTVRNAVALHAPVVVSTDVGQALAGTYNRLSAANDFRWRSVRRLPASDPRALARRSEAQRSSALARDGLRYVAAHPLAPLEAGAWNSARLLELDRDGRAILAAALGSRRLARVSYVGFWALSVLAGAGALTRRARRAPGWLWLAPVLLWLGTVPFAVNFSRFRAPIDPFLVLLAALALSAAGEQVARRWALRRRAAHLPAGPASARA